METASMKFHNDVDFPFNPVHTKSFLILASVSGIHNPHYKSDQIPNSYQMSDIEMVDLDAAYTSLKDLLPTSPPSILSPNNNSRKDSWREIPIKDPLLQHAAWAYLQPMAAAPEANRQNFLENFKKKCCDLFDCFAEVFLAVGKNWFSGDKDDDCACGEGGVEDGGEKEN